MTYETPRWSIYLWYAAGAAPASNDEHDVILPWTTVYPAAFSPVSRCTIREVKRAGRFRSIGINTFFRPPVKASSHEEALEL